MNKKLKEEVWSHFEHTQNIFLATLDGKKPKVRPVTMIFNNDRFWVTTGADNAKVKQIKENPNTEFCLMFKEGEYNGYIRGGGIAVIIDDIETKKMIAGSIPFFKEYWKSVDDPSFALLEIVIKEIEYLRPGELYVKRFSL
jgi:uncharacterized pyridoxamine 5'-phosphate oxidase family protein